MDLQLTGSDQNKIKNEKTKKNAPTVINEKSSNSAQDISDKGSRKMISEPSDTRLPGQSVGETLKKTRESKGFSRQEAAQVLRISERYLQALEQGELKNLPEKVYALGFLRSYALHLSLDPEPLIKQLQTEFNTSYQQQKIQFKQATPANQIPARPLAIGSAVLAVVLMVGWQYYKAPSSGGKTEFYSKSLVDSLETKDQSKAALADSSNDLTEESLSPLQEKISDVSLQETATVFAQEALPENLQDDREETRNLPDVPLEEFRLTSGRPFKIQATLRSWVEIRKKNGDVLLSRILQEGDTRELKAQPGLLFSTGNAAGIIFSTQNQKTLALGKEGQILRDISFRYTDTDSTMLVQSTNLEESVSLLDSAAQEVKTRESGIEPEKSSVDMRKAIDPENPEVEKTDAGGSSASPSAPR